MRLVKPFDVDDTVLTSTSVVNDYPDWTAGTYTLGQRRVEDNKVYEVVADPSTTDQPSVGVTANPPTWILIGWSNQYRMFRDGSDSKSTSTDNITVDLVFSDIVNTIGLLGLLGNTVSLTVTDSVEGVVYSQTIDLIDAGAGDWWEWHFLPYESKTTTVFSEIPPYNNATYELVLSGLAPTDPVECGRVVAGVETGIGAMRYDTSVGVIEYSTKERDGFGNLTLVPRRTVRRVDYDLIMETNQVSYIQRELTSISAQPTLFIGDDSTDWSIVFGVYRDFDISVSSPSISYASLQVEGF